MTINKGELSERLLPFDDSIKLYVDIPGYGLIPVLGCRYTWYGGEGVAVLSANLPRVARPAP